VPVQECTLLFLYLLEITYVSVQNIVHHRKHPGLGHLARCVSRVTTALANVSSVFQLFFFLVVCSDMTSKGFGFVAFFASVKASSVCIHLSCLVCSLSVVNCVQSLLFCGHEGCSLPEVSITSFLPLQIFRLCKAVRVQFSDPYKNVGKTKVLYNFKIVSVLTFLKIVLLIVPTNCKNFANLRLVLAPRGIIDTDRWYPQNLGNYRLT
jgi:hypothetical protein